MKKSVIKKVLITTIIVLLSIFCLYNLYKVVFTGKQKIKVTLGNQYYAGNDIEGIVEVRNLKHDELIKSNLKIKLKDENNKTVKGSKITYKIEAGERANISLKIPDKIENGKYNLQITSSSNLLRDTIKMPINIIEGKLANTSIFLDKGIYKPGDEVNYRVLITSAKDDKPIKETVTVCIYDGNNNKVYNEKIETSEFGILSGKFTLANEVNSGSYKIEIERQSENISKIFKVNPYITPKFEANITSNKDKYLVGEDINIVVSSKYFFGEPVKNATVKGMIGEKEVTGITDENGNLEFNEKAEKTGKLNISLEIIDSSNYSVEASKQIFIATDAFEIEVLPEFGSIIKGIDNEIYIITKNIDGTPVKTYADINFNNVSRQVVTDENGIGKIVFSEYDLENLNVNSRKYYNQYSTTKTNTEIFSITAENMNGEKVSVNKDVEINNISGVLVKTDKVKYNVGEDINLSLKTNNDTQTRNVAIYKNEELIKVISTENDEVSVNLEDIYGIVDIYTFSDTSQGFYRNNYENKKTIYIKPEKELNISIKTNAQEYKPADNLELNIETKDENNTLVDSALLVSILDEAILSLESNDLSIDNIKLALSSIKLTSDITAADLYASAIDEKSDTLLMSILLKQESNNSNVKSSTIRNYTRENLVYFIYSAIILGLILFIKLILKSKKREKILLIAMKLVVFTIIYIVMLFIFAEILIDNLEFNVPMVLISNLVISIITYLLILNKYDKFILNMAVDLLGFPLIAAIIIAIFEEYAFFIALIPLLILAILINLKERKATNKYDSIIKVFKRIAKIELIFPAISIILGVLISVLENVLYISPGYGFIEKIILVIAIIGIYYLLSKIFYRGNKNKKIKNGKIVIDLTGMEIIGIIVAIGLIILVIYGIIKSNSLTLSRPVIYDSEMPMDSTVSFNDIDTTIKAESAQGAASSSISSGFGGLFNSFSNNIEQNSSVAMDTADEIYEDFTELENDLNVSLEKQDETEENVRNIFLESLAFIPELVTENGNANTNIKISDNITTWSIQVVGNTKNGNIGYASSNIKVFKDFFIDFSLPTNSVVTDKINIPVTVYNYTDNELKVNLNVKENEWSKVGNYKNEIVVPSKNTTLIYVPLEVLKHGNNTLRIEAKVNGISDIVEKTMEVRPNGLEISSIVSSGNMEKKMEQDIIFNDKKLISETEELVLKLYPSAIAQVVNGMENILRMPTGCFEQTSSALYPNVLVLEYLENNNTVDEKIKEKAIKYISSGYQRLLTFEVPGEKGGFSLYGESPAETVLTAYGLMELKELSEVYEIDSKVLENMKEFIFKKQNVNGTFDYDSTYIGNPSSRDKLAMNAYITWALSEAYPEDSRLEKSVEYLENNINKANDNYTIALIANVLINVNSNKKDEVLEKLSDKVIVNGEEAYITSISRDYYGSCGRTQNIQATALTSIAFTKSNKYSKSNNLLINYLIKQKDSNGTWYSTQSTVLALKALVEYSEKSDITNQDIKVSLNGKEQIINIEDNALDIYEIKFDNVEKENKLSIEMKKGKITYEIVQKYYADYSKIEEKEKNNFEVQQEINTNVAVNEKIIQKLEIKNLTNETITNGLIQISIPQGCSVDEESLLKLKYNGLIEKYEYNYGKINLYVRNFNANNILKLEILYKALYPEEITGGTIRIFDYYNPEIEEIIKPQKFITNE